MLKEGMTIKLHPGTDAEAYARLVRREGFRPLIYPDRIIISSKEKDKKQIGKLIQAGRRRLGISQEKLADKIGCSVSSVRNWEEGRYYPRQYMIEDLKKIGIKFEPGEEKSMTDETRTTLQEYYGFLGNTKPCLKSAIGEVLEDQERIESRICRESQRTNAEGELIYTKSEIAIFNKCLEIVKGES